MANFCRNNFFILRSLISWQIKLKQFVKIKMSLFIFWHFVKLGSVSGSAKNESKNKVCKISTFELNTVKLTISIKKNQSQKPSFCNRNREEKTPQIYIFFKFFLFPGLRRVHSPLWDFYFMGYNIWQDAGNRTRVIATAARCATNELHTSLMSYTLPSKDIQLLFCLQKFYPRMFI